MPKLVLISGKDMGKEYPLTGQEAFVLGRVASCNVILHGRMVSRKHATIEKREDGYYIRDTNSYNGTFVNSKRVNEPGKLRDGDEIRIADRHLRFVEDSLPTSPGADSPAPESEVEGSQPTSIEKVDLSITTGDFDSLWSRLTEAPEEKRPAVASIDFDITQDIIEEASGDEEEQKKIAEMRRIVKGGSLSGKPEHFVRALREYVKINCTNPEILELIEEYVRFRALAVMGPAERREFLEVLKDLERRKPAWILKKRYKAFREGLK